MMAGFREINEDVHFAPVIKAKAMTLLTLMGKPTFIVALVVLDRSLRPLQLPTKLLQGTELEVLSAYSMMSAVIQVFFLIVLTKTFIKSKSIRSNCQNHSCGIQNII